MIRQMWLKVVEKERKKGMAMFTKKHNFLPSPLQKIFVEFKKFINRLLDYSNKNYMINSFFIVNIKPNKKKPVIGKPVNRLL